MYGKDSEKITNSIRFSFGFTTTTEEILKASEETAKAVRRLTK